MIFSNLIAYFIILASCQHTTRAWHRNIQTAGEAAEALRPIAGNLAFLLFALGIIGTGLLCDPGACRIRRLCCCRTLRMALDAGGEVS